MSAIKQSRIDFIAKQIELNGEAMVDLKCLGIPQSQFEEYILHLARELPEELNVDFNQTSPGVYLFINMNDTTPDLLTWEPTMKLRWKAETLGWFDPVFGPPFKIPLDHAPKRLQQLWTNGKEEEWRDVEVQEE